MAFSAGYNTSIKISGTSTAMTDEAMSGSGAGPYQITNTAKRVLDRTVVPTFEDNGTPIDSADISSIDYLFGKVTFTGAKTGPITMATGSYMPMAAVVQAKSYKLAVNAEVLDDTDYATAQAAAWLSRVVGLSDVSLEIGRFDDIAGTYIDKIIAGSVPVLVEIQPGGTGNYWRGWFVGDNAGNEGAVADLQTESLSFVLDGSATASFSQGT